MTGSQRSRFEELRRTIREVEKGVHDRFDRQASEWERRFEWLVRENASLRTELARLQHRMKPPEAWRDFDEDTDRKESA